MESRSRSIKNKDIHWRNEFTPIRLWTYVCRLLAYRSTGTLVCGCWSLDRFPHEFVHLLRLYLLRIFERGLVVKAADFDIDTQHHFDKHLHLNSSPFFFYFNDKTDLLLLLVRVDSTTFFYSTMFIAKRFSRHLRRHRKKKPRRTIGRHIEAGTNVAAQKTTNGHYSSRVEHIWKSVERKEFPW